MSPALRIGLRFIRQADVRVIDSLYQVVYFRNIFCHCVMGIDVADYVIVHFL